MSETISIDLSPVINAVDVVNQNIRIVADQIDGVHRDMNDVHAKIERLTQDFYAFVLKDSLDKEIQKAMTDIIRIRQEIEKNFGYYDEVRRRTTGILQAVDISVVRKETITNCTEELMLAAPRYWLAPSLIALSAWINNNQELAGKAIKEALRRDDEKTSLLFALINRRAGRYNASEIWLERYLSMQDPTGLEREMVVVIDAYASGLFGSDSQGKCSKVIKVWIEELSEKVGFVEDQHKQWSDAILSKIHKYSDGHFQYLTKYSPTWGQLENSLSDVKLHQTIYDYFMKVFSGVIDPPKNLNFAVDDLLDKLVTNFDNEELSLRREERLTTLIIEEKGDRDSAQRRYDLEKKSLDERFNFTQLLTNAAMHPETSHASKGTQRLSIAMSKDWIIKAYEDITAKNRSKVPLDIGLKIEDWQGNTRDGSNEQELLGNLKNHLDGKLAKVLEEIKPDIMHWFSLVGGSLIALWGIKPPVNPLLIILGLGGVVWFVTAFLNVKKKKEKAEKDFEKYREQHRGILKALLAETVDLRKEMRVEDAKYDNVMHFLEEITPQQFISSNFSPSRTIAG